MYFKKNHKIIKFWSASETLSQHQTTQNLNKDSCIYKV